MFIAIHICFRLKINSLAKIAIFGRTSNKSRVKSTSTPLTSKPVPQVARRTDNTVAGNQKSNRIVAIEDFQSEQGMFVGGVADNFDERIEQKIFHAEIVVDDRVSAETKAYKKIPVITNFVDDNGVDRMKEMIQENYNRIKAETKRIVADELERIKNDPDLCHLLPKKE